MLKDYFKLPKIQIDINKFYTIGVWCFGIMAIMNTVSFVVNVMNSSFLLPTDLISAAVSVFFNYALFGFFFYLRSTLPPKDLKQGSEAEMLALLNNKGGKTI